MKRNRVLSILTLAIVIIFISSQSCATKKFVKTEVGAVDQQVKEVKTAVDENNKTLQAHEEKLASLGSLITQQGSELKNVETSLEEVRRIARGKLIFTEVLKNDEVKFAFNQAELTPEAKARLDEFVQKLIELDRGLYLEIRGHTDNTGPDSWNMTLGKMRAEAVKDYLYRQHHIPLHRMEVISFGSSAPVADNNSREGRAANRRVEILVYE